MRRWIVLLPLFALSQSLVLADVTQLWQDLTAKRQALSRYHQELETTTTFTLPDHVQSSTRSSTLDGAGTRWRTHTASGGGDWSFLFNGSGYFYIEDAEYTSKKLSRDEVPEPAPYDQSEVDLKKGVELKRFPCGLTGVDHQCIAIDIPVKARVTSPDKPRITGGGRRLLVDSVTGLVLLSETVTGYENRSYSYRGQVVIKTKQLSSNGVADPALFQIAAGCSQVKEISKWDAKRMKKELAGKPAPDLVLQDIHGKPVKLSDLKGKTVLLDFWATWCGPCRADGPSLDKLYTKYGGNSLSIVGISVDEEHATVEKFLNEHPHPYSIALTSENEIPHAYRVGVFPTYIIIDPDGNFADATEGTSGFSTLKKLLKRAGMDTD